MLHTRGINKWYDLHQLFCQEHKPTGSKDTELACVQICKREGGRVILDA
jgi:hypothetical protein